MFDFITDEHKMIQSAARDFARNSIAPIAAEFDESGDFPLETIREMGQLGFMGIEVPEEYGGAGMDTLAYVLAMVEICKVDASHGTIMSVKTPMPTACSSSARRSRSRSTSCRWRRARRSAPTA